MASATVLPAAPRTQRERQRLDTRERLYQLAIDEFRRVGTQRARVRDIVEAAGVVAGTFYFHFPTKDHVIFELWLRNAKRLLERLPDAGGQGSDAPSVGEYLRAVCDGMVDVEQEVGAPELVRNSLAIVLRPPSGVDLAENPIGEQLVRFLTEASERGEISNALRPEEIASVLLTSILGALAAASDDPAERRRALRRTIDFFLKALH
jgi:AcrR family transcriptional regulator